MKRGLEVTDLRMRRSKAFQLAIDNLALPAGKILCVAGPNGSGKTTLIDCLAGLLVPDSGKATLNGQTVEHNLRVTRNSIGYIPDDEAWLIKELCAKEYFDLLIEVYRTAGVHIDLQTRIHKLSKALYFTDFLPRLEQLSHGNKKKVQLIAGLMHAPKLLIVDELRNGLDPLAVIAAENLLKQEAKRGACVVAATHDLWWAERMADEILLLVNGQPVVHQTTSAIVRRHGSLEKLFLKTVRTSSK